MCSVSSGGTPSRSEPKYWNEGTIPWIKTGELKNKVLMDTGEKITEEGLNNSSAKIYPKGSVVIAMYGATIGQTAKLGIDATTNQACAVLFNFDKFILNDFVWEYLKTQTEKLKGLGYGSAQPNLNANIISNYQIPVPPLAKQQEIVAQIEGYEAEITKLEQMMAQSNDKKKAILEKYL